MNARHLSKTAEWGSPSRLVEIAHLVLPGGVDLDPASSDFWNRMVRARRFIDVHEDGLLADWSPDGFPVTVFLNPPGDQTGQLVKDFWNRLASKWLTGEVRSAVWVGFNLEQLTYLQDHRVSPPGLPTCIPRNRIPYRRFEDGIAREVDDPTHGSFFTLLPERGGDGQQVGAFARLTAPLGKTINVRTTT